MQHVIYDHGYKPCGQLLVTQAMLGYVCPYKCVCLASLSQVVAELCVIGFEGSAALAF